MIKKHIKDRIERLVISIRDTGLFIRFKHVARRLLTVIIKRPAAIIFSVKEEPKPAFINQIFVINLDQQKKRWKCLNKEAGLHKIKNGRKLKDILVRSPAYDKRKVNLENFDSDDVEKSYKLSDHYYVDPDDRLSILVRNKEVKLEMSKAEIAIAISHLNLWKKIVNEEINYALILEDDVYFEQKFSNYINHAWSELPVDDNNKKQFDLLFLSYKEVANDPEKTEYSNTLFRPVRGFWWMSGYIISLQGAKKLLERLPVKGPVDMWINLQFSEMNVFSVSKSIVSQRKDWGSNNAYSISQVLSEVGINWGNKTGIRYIPKRKPVFAIGLNKTATSSLYHALKILGYNACHWIDDEFSNKTAKLIERKKPLPFDAYTDVQSIMEKYTELDKQYPDAAFILTVRDVDDWIASRTRHVMRNINEKLQDDYVNLTKVDIEGWKEEWIKHNNAVKDHFKYRENKLLILIYAPVMDGKNCVISLIFLCPILAFHMLTL